jgi:hypothetical protein
MQDFETLGDAAIHAERAASHALEAAVNERRAVRPDECRGELGDQYDLKVDEMMAAWIEALERRWTLT